MKNKSSKFSVLFVYPPSADPTVPPVSHSRLSPWVPGSWDAEYLDENREFINYIISIVVGSYTNPNKPIKQIGFKKVFTENETLEGEKEKYGNIEKTSLKDNILKALGILKSSLFFDINHYIAANSVLEFVFKQFSKMYYPSQIGYASSKLIYSPFSSDDIRSAINIENSDKNPFIDFFKFRIDKYGHRDSIAISVIYSSQIIPALTLAKLYSKVFPDTLIFLGGPALFHIAKDLIQLFNCVDAIIPLDGEYFFKNCSNLIEYLAFQKKKGKLTRDNIDLNNCTGFYDFNGPLPEHSFFSYKNYLLPIPVAVLDITRGCYYGKCVFCAYGFNIAPYRVMPIKDVLEVLKVLKEKYRIDNFLFSVDVIDTNYFNKLAENIVKNG